MLQRFFASFLLSLVREKQVAIPILISATGLCRGYLKLRVEICRSEKKRVMEKTNLVNPDVTKRKADIKTIARATHFNARQ